ncbi:MAG: repeat-associated core domain protein [Hydrocarboniphaga sp.]|nr:repeat-associated core domain protein [Hydrocarboniphaga sp.]
MTLGFSSFLRAQVEVLPRIVVSILFILCSQIASAESLSYADETAKKVHAASSIGALGDGLLGDTTDWYSGQTSFRVVDIDIPGNSELPVQIARTLSTVSPEGTSLNPFMMGDWDLDLPYVSGVFPTSEGWTPSNRCSGSIVPSGVSGFSVDDWWRGTSISIPGLGTKNLLLRDPSYSKQPTDGVTYTRVTSDHTQIACLSTLASGQTGEGFQAITADGVKYTFNWMVSRTFSTVRSVQGASLPRVEVRIYATRVEDRFGNWVQYTYQGNLLQTIEANDGRVISLGYNAGNKIQTVSANGRTWTYTYFEAYLSQVTLPDQSYWTINHVDLRIEYNATPAAATPCNLQPTSAWSSVPQSWTMRHPSGATGTFTFTPVRQDRKVGADKICLYNQTDKLFERYGPAKQFDVYALTNKTLTGPGLPTLSWSADYGQTASNTRTVTVTRPDGSKLRNTYGAQFYIDEGKLMKSEVLDSSGAVVTTTNTTFATSPSSPAYAYRVGYTGQEIVDGYSFREDAFSSVLTVPETTAQIVRSGDTYSRQVNSFDSFARPLSVTRSNSVGNSRTDVSEYYDDTTKWVLGKSKKSTNSNAGLVESQTDYGATNALPEKTYTFGLLQQTASYNADGTLNTVADRAGNATTYSSWKRGMPQLIQYPLSISQSAVVDDSGWITSVTDRRGSTTGYGYDSMGRISRITYPTDDTNVWNDLTQSFVQVSSAEYGLPAGHWRQTVQTADIFKITYYDALWRPVLRQEYDQDDIAGTQLFFRKTFNSNGLEALVAYPSTSSSETAGIVNEYDALKRLIKRRTADNVTLEKTNYSIAGNKKKVTDGDGQGTTISYLGYDEPGGSPIRIEAPEGQTTQIGRDVFGKITTIQQSGAWSGGTATATRTLSYDPYQRLCRRSDPEGGVTLWGYDADNRLAFEARGQSASTCQTMNADGTSSAPSDAAVFSYDNLSRKTGVDYPGTSDDIAYLYDNENNTTRVLNPVATWNYSYNKRNLLEIENVKVDGKVFKMRYKLDGIARLGRLYTPSNNYFLEPDSWGRPQQIEGYVSGIKYHPSGQTQSYSLSNGLTYSLTLDTLKRPWVQTTTAGASPIQKYQYGYTTAGDLTSFDDQVDDTDDLTASYDGLHRLASASGVWGSYGFTYDTLNNVRARTNTNALTYTINTTTNRLDSVSGSQSRTYSYNSRGEISSDGIRTFTLNALGQVTAVSGATYQYDGNGKRIKTVKGGVTEYTLYTHDGQMIYSEKGTEKTDYLSLNGKTVVEVKNVGGVFTPTYLHPDLLGSPRKATNASGATLWQEHYDPYGAKLNGVTDKVGYTGHAFDSESGLTYAQARFYDPLIGRFLSTDPVYFSDQNPFTFNRYAYANNNPYRYTDPTGMCTGSLISNKDGTCPSGGFVSGFGGVAYGLVAKASSGSDSFDRGSSQGSYNFVNGAGPTVGSNLYASESANTDGAVLPDLKPETFYEHFLVGSGRTVVLTEEQFSEVNHQGHVESAAKNSNGIGYSLLKSFYGTPLANTFGSATISIDDSYSATGFHDTYNFDMHSRPTFKSQVMTGIGATGYIFGAKDFQVVYP